MKRILFGPLLAAHVALAGTTAQGDALRVDGASFIGDLPTLVADERGFFLAAGVETEVSYGFDVGAKLRALRDGETDVVLMAMTPFVIDRLRDGTPGESNDPVILGNLLHGVSDMRIAAPRSAGIDVPGDLVGKRVGLPLGTISDYLWSLFAAFHGIDGESVDLVDLGFDEIPQALIEGRIDATLLWEPWEAFEQRWQLPLTTFPGEVPFSLHWLVVTTNDVLKERPDDIAALLEGYAVACDWIEQNPAEAVQVFAERWGSPLQFNAMAARRMPIFSLTLDWSIYASYREQSAWAARAGHADRSENGSFISAVATAPLATVSPASVLLPRAPRPGTPGDAP